MISRGFFKSSLIYSFVGALPYASGIILLPWFTAYLTPRQFGINALYMAFMYFIQIISSFGMDMSVGVLYFDYRDDKAKLKEFLGTAFISIAILGGFTFIIFSLGGFRIFNFVFNSSDFMDLVPFGLFTIISGIFNGIFKTYSSLLINQERPAKFFSINIINFVVTIAATLGLLYRFPYTLYGPTLGRLIPAVISASTCLFLTSKEYGMAWNSEYLKKIISYTYPLVIYSLLMWVVTYIDRFIILRMMGDSTMVGIYDIAAKLVIFIELLVTGLANTVNPKIYGIWKDQEVRESTVEINRYYNGMTAFFLLLIPLFVLVVPLVIPLIIHNKTYYLAFGFLAILAAGYATRVWFYMFFSPLMFFKKTKALPRVFVISALFNILVGIVLIKYFGLMGAVWTNFMVKPLQAFLMWLECRKIYKIRVNPWKIFYAPGIFIAVVLLSETFLPPAYKFRAEIGQLFIACALVYFAYRKELVPFVLKIVKR